MLINESHISKIDIYNFFFLSGHHEISDLSTYHSPNRPQIICAIDWALGTLYFSRRDIISSGRNFTSVRVTIQNPNLFLHKSNIVIIERRMYREHKSEFFINNQESRFKDIKTMLSSSK